MKALLIKKTKEMPATDSKMGYACFEMQDTEINGLADMQNAVEGDIEGWDYIPKLYKNGIVLYCNDEGKLMGLLPAVVVIGKKQRSPFAEREIIEQLCGNILLCGYDFESDKSVSLTDYQMEIIRRVFKRARYFTGSVVIDGYTAEAEDDDNA